MKKTFFALWLCCVTIILSLTMNSCNDDDGDQNNHKVVVTDDDPVATSVVKLQSGEDNNWMDILGNSTLIHISGDNNFESNNGNALFVSVGNVKGLSDIQSLPSGVWSSSLPVVQGMGYIVYDPVGFEVMRIYVAEYCENKSGEITGAIIKCAPIDSKMDFDKSYINGKDRVLTDDQQIKIIASNLEQFYIVPLTTPTGYDVVDKPDWVKVIQNVSKVQIHFLKNNGAVRNGEVILGNTKNSMKIYLTQKGVED